MSVEGAIRRPGVRLILLLGVLAGSAGSADAQIVECPGLVSEPGLKILLDEISYLGSGPTQTGASLTRKAEFRLKTSLEAVGLGFDRLRIVPCRNRRPRGTADFNISLVQRLDDNDALVEVWGEVQPAGTPLGSAHDVSLRYLLVPARRTELSRGRPPGVYETLFNALPGGSPDEALKVFDRTDELAAFLSIGLGIKADRGDQYEEAYASLCKGYLGLWPSGPEPRERKHRPLLDYVSEIVLDTVSRARADSDYKGPLKDLFTNDQARTVCGRVSQ